MNAPEPIECPRCGDWMLPVPDGGWQLFDAATWDFICPRCLHTARVRINPNESKEEKCPTNRHGRTPT